MDNAEANNNPAAAAAATQAGSAAPEPQQAATPEHDGAASAGQAADTPADDSAADAAATPAAVNDTDAATRAATQLPINGLAITNADELTQLARAALSQGQASLFNSDGTPLDPAAQAAAVSAALNAFPGTAGLNLTGLLAQSPAGVLNPAALQNPANALAMDSNALNALLLSINPTSGTLNLAGQFGGQNSGLSLSMLGDVSSFGGAAAAGAGGLGYNTAVGMSNISNAGAMGLAGGDIDEDAPVGKGNTSSGNKQLSSRYRGVCWNKKNKRWQAAINSGGKYIYLGSFTNEDDAARHFDRAAIKIRGKKAKLNFHYHEYVDADGNLLEDIVLTGAGTDGKEPGKPPSTSGPKSAGGRASKGGMGAADAAYSAAATPDYLTAAGGMGFGSNGGAGLGVGDLSLLAQPGLAAQQAALLGGLGGLNAAAAGGHLGWGGRGLDGVEGLLGRGKGIQIVNVNDLQALLPKGCNFENMVNPPNAECSSMFGVVYKNELTGQRGAALYTGFRFHVFGYYTDENDAKQTCTRSMELLAEDRQIRGSAADGSGLTDASGLARGLEGFTGLQGALNPAGTGSAADQEQLIAALGLQGVRAAGLLPAGAVSVGGANANVLGTLIGVVDPARLAPGTSGGTGVGVVSSLGEYDIARAAQLAQQAAAEQGVNITSVSMSFPPLSVGLPTLSVGLPTPLSVGLPTLSMGLPVAASTGGTAGEGAAAEAELQAKLQQIMQQQGQQQQGVDTQQQGQQQQTGAAADGGMFARLANLDMAQLRQQLLEQQQHQGSGEGQDATAADAKAAALRTAASIEDIVAAVTAGSGTKRPLGNAGSGGVVTSTPWPEGLTGLLGAVNPAAAGAVAAAEDPVVSGAKRQKTDANSNGAGQQPAATAPAAGPAAAAGPVPASGAAGLGGSNGGAVSANAVAAIGDADGSAGGHALWANLQNVGLQDALKALSAVAQSQQQQGAHS
eukprot:GHRR01002457.1.p1 GENE.GHRR01002457.1~~GHRR01002457.1.p1  ORF type:complete len:961 (+),score=474.22 GHRR01002457.1:588-3470(+)